MVGAVVVVFDGVEEGAVAMSVCFMAVGWGWKNGVNRKRVREGRNSEQEKGKNSEERGKEIEEGNVNRKKEREEERENGKKEREGKAVS
jgi:hypothetical protein